MKIARSPLPPVAPSPGPMPPPVTDLAETQQRLADAQLRLREGLRNGTLTQAEAARLQGQLSALQTRLEKTAFDADGFTPADCLRLNAAITGLDQRVGVERHDLQANLGKRLDDAERRVKEGLADGSLTQKEADALGERIKTLRGNLDGARWGGLSDVEKAELNKKVNQLDGRVHSARTNGAFDADKRFATFERRIDAGAKDGSLSKAEVERLRTGLADLKAKYDGAKLGGLDANERIRLTKALNGFSGSIFKQRHDTQVDVGQRTSAVQRQIDSAVRAGRLSPAQADALRAELTHVTDTFKPEDVGARLNALAEKIATLVLGQPAVQPVAQQVGP